MTIVGGGRVKAITRTASAVKKYQIKHTAVKKRIFKQKSGYFVDSIFATQNNFVGKITKWFIFDIVWLPFISNQIKWFITKFFI
jgi:hypothetical protein